ncbi:MAG: hemerythrin domain-containing protein [Planctomycetota bacterium]|jgi:hemerythrin-like domain-containing protein
MSTIHPHSSTPGHDPSADKPEAAGTCSAGGAQPTGGTCGHHASAFGILSDCHEHIGERLTVLEDVARQLGADQTLTDAQRTAVRDVLAFFEKAIPIHSADEEQTLFPRLRERPPFAGTVGTPMDCMESEHVEHAALRSRLAEALEAGDGTGLGRAARALAAEYRSHISKEEQILYPMAREVLTDPALLDVMAEEMRARRRDAGHKDC